MLPEDVGALIVAAFGLVVFFVAVRTVQPREAIEACAAHDLAEDAGELRVPAGIA